MADQNPNVADIFKTWKQMYDQFETTWAKPVQEMLESESFTQSLSQSRTQYVNSQKVNREAIEQQLEALRIPTKTDLARLATQILSVENRAEAIEDAVEDLASHLKRIETKLDQLLGVTAPAVDKPVIAPAKPSPVVAQATAKASQAAAPAAAVKAAAVKAAAKPAASKEAKPVVKAAAKKPAASKAGRKAT